jgi:general secretion pathway protein J
LLDRIDGLQLRYLGSDGAWRETWPPPVGTTSQVGDLPRAIEFRWLLNDIGEIRRVVELASTP